jgi:sigma-B regulation protein RsbQ
MNKAELTARFNVHVSGHGKTPMLFAHGFGCDQNMWRYVVPAFEDDYQVVLFDHIGAGGSDLSAYDPAKYASLNGYADDIIAICTGLQLKRVVFVGHSVSAMIGIVASIKAPDLFANLILVGPSPRYINDAGYTGGFSEGQINQLLEFLDSNHMGWSQAMAPVIMGNSDRPELGDELTNSFCRTDPDIAKRFARATFLSDNREDLSRVVTPSLILQCSEDVIAPREVGEYVHDNLKNSQLTILKATGHCPNLSAPKETIAAIKAYL